MKKRQINAEIEYRLSKWMAYNMLQEGFISVEEYQTACSEFLQAISLLFGSTWRLPLGELGAELPAVMLEAHFIDAQNVVDAACQKNAVLFGINRRRLRGIADGDIQLVRFRGVPGGFFFAGRETAGDGGCLAGEEVSPCGFMVSVLIHHSLILLDGNPHPKSRDVHEITPSRMPKRSDRSVRVRSWWSASSRCSNK